MTTKSLLAIITTVPLIVSGCAGEQTRVIASTVTVIGVELGQGSATPTVTGTLGYKRAELAIVPTDRAASIGGGASGDEQGNAGGASNSADVIMELNYKGIFSSGGGIYQRLAVGKNAVNNSAATALFSKTANGQLNPLVLAAARGKFNEDSRKATMISRCFDNQGSVDTQKRSDATKKAAVAAPEQYSPSAKKALERITQTDELNEFLSDLGNGMVSSLFDSLPESCK